MRSSRRGVTEDAQRRLTPDHVLIHHIRLSVVDEHAGVGVFLLEIALHLVQQVDPRGVNRRHVHFTAHRGMVLNLAGQLDIAVENLPAAAVVHFPAGREGQRSGGPVDQPHAQILLKIHNSLAGSGLRHTIQRRAPADRPVLRHIAEQFDAVHLHSYGRIA